MRQQITLQCTCHNSNNNNSIFSFMRKKVVGASRCRIMGL